MIASYSMYDIKNEFRYACIEDDVEKAEMLLAQYPYVVSQIREACSQAIYHQSLNILTFFSQHPDVEPEIDAYAIRQYCTDDQQYLYFIGNRYPQLKFDVNDAVIDDCLHDKKLLEWMLSKTQITHDTCLKYLNKAFKSSKNIDVFMRQLRHIDYMQYFEKLVYIQGVYPDIYQVLMSEHETTPAIDYTIY